MKVGMGVPLGLLDGWEEGSGTMGCFVGMFTGDEDGFDVGGIVG